MRSPSTSSASAPSPARASASTLPCTSDTTCTRMVINLRRRLARRATRLQPVLAGERDGLGRALAAAGLHGAAAGRRGTWCAVRPGRIGTQEVVQDVAVEHGFEPDL